MESKTIADRKLWALILGVSSGFGRETALELAKNGYNIYGVHLDTGENKAKTEQFRKVLETIGVQAVFFNTNAANDENRHEVINIIKENQESDPHHVLRVVLHSLAFGAIGPFFDQNPEKMLNKKQIEMTMDVMANTLIYWVQDLIKERLLAENSRIFAMTSVGSIRAMPNYGAISAAKAALEAYIRQIAVELAPLKITANAIMAGLTDTPAAAKIPGFSKMLQYAREHNPFQRNTVPLDVAKAISLLVDEKFYWITGDTIRVDGGESILNFIEID
ncbi:MAG TPA: SDR family oxidoreductase [Bacteroidota bacterium]|nr:SDR family oxidoreductase [Candidatus Kapabacteria bacterium]HRS01231.1 SDR family oxidoreductase [Bacteroidota bacterium]